MEVDKSSEIEERLLAALRSMGTNDRDMLVRQFLNVLGPDHTLTERDAEFFLEMNSWNLQEAIGSFYDYGASQGAGFTASVSNLPSMAFLADVTVGGNCESVSRRTRFVKTWRVKNTVAGDIEWPSGCHLERTEGDRFSNTDRIYVPSIKPGETTDISVELTSPQETGLYQSIWRMLTAQEVPFGDPIWCILNVDDNGILDVTQQIANLPTSSSTNILHTADHRFLERHRHEGGDMEDLDDELDTSLRVLPSDSPLRSITPSTSATSLTSSPSASALNATTSTTPSRPIPSQQIFRLYPAAPPPTPAYCPSPSTSPIKPWSLSNSFGLVNSFPAAQQPSLIPYDVSNVTNVSSAIPSEAVVASQPVIEEDNSMQL